MKQVYFYDLQTKAFSSYDVIDDNAEMPTNATTVAPVDSNGIGLYDPTWNESKQGWDSLTEEEWIAKHPTQTVKKETTQQQAADVALKKELISLKQSNIILSNKIDGLNKVVIAIKKQNIAE